MKLKPWIESLRLRTLPVSIAGVLAGCAIGAAYGNFSIAPALICLVFAVIAQIVSNLANEYYDFENGFDKKGRQGFRRSVTEGDISPSAMKWVMITLMALDCLLGCTLIHWGGYWLILIGVLIVLAAFAYSAGPWPFSQHGLGDELVVVFYGIIPVSMTAYLQCGDWTGGLIASVFGEMWKIAIPVGLGVGLLGDNVLTVNNIRDVEDDAAVGKHTKAVIFGVKVMRIAYIICWMVGIGLIWYAFRHAMPWWCVFGYAAIAIWYAVLSFSLYRLKGKPLNKVLKYTSVQLLTVVLWTIICVVLYHDTVVSIHNPNCLIHQFLLLF